MGKTHIFKRIHVEAPIELVFERIADHDAMSDWPGITSCRLVREGEPRNGLGAVREVKTHGLTLHEDIVYYDTPNGYDYKIVKGLMRSKEPFTMVTSVRSYPRMVFADGQSLTAEHDRIDSTNLRFLFCFSTRVTDRSAWPPNPGLMSSSQPRSIDTAPSKPEVNPE